MCYNRSIGAGEEKAQSNLCASNIKRPHDKLFRSVFADPHEAAAFLRPHLPPALVERFDWSSLTLEETSFVDEALQESESDLLYTVQGTT
ncbi:MAG: Rpn family recombination-promoting nuclease/putative transposase, partial [Caldilinea sp.]